MLRTLVLYGSYRRERAGVRLARFAVEALRTRGHAVELVDARQVETPTLDQLSEEPHSAADGRIAAAELAGKIREADAFVFVAGAYGWDMQPGLKSLTDHYREAWFWRPAAILSYSAARTVDARSNFLWHGTLSELGMIVIPSTMNVGQALEVLNAEGRPLGAGGAALAESFSDLAAELEWWARAAKHQRTVETPPF